MRMYSWACFGVLDNRGKLVNGGCGGNWGPTLPRSCPSCGGPLRTMQEFQRVTL